MSEFVSEQEPASMEESYHLEAVHEANLKILKEIDRICRKHGIRYALDAGTLIGCFFSGKYLQGLLLCRLPGWPEKNCREG